MPEPQAPPEARAPDGAAEDLFASPDLFADVDYPMKNIPAIQLIKTRRPKTKPFLMEMHPALDIRGPVDWPDDTPINTMTATHIPVEHDIRYCNANLKGVQENANEDSRIGFYHYFSDLHRRILCDHWVITGEDQLLVDTKQQTFVHDTDFMLMTALSPKFTGVMESRDPDGSAKLPGQGQFV